MWSHCLLVSKVSAKKPTDNLIEVLPSRFSLSLWLLVVLLTCVLVEYLWVYLTWSSKSFLYLWICTFPQIWTLSDNFSKNNLSAPFSIALFHWVPSYVWWPCWQGPMLCYGLNVSFTQKFISWNPNAQCDNIRRWNPHKCDECSYKRDSTVPSPAPSAMWTELEGSVCEPGGKFLSNLAGILILRLPVSRLWEISEIYKPPSLWYFVISTQKEENRFCSFSFLSFFSCCGHLLISIILSSFITLMVLSSSLLIFFLHLAQNCGWNPLVNFSF